MAKFLVTLQETKEYEVVVESPTLAEAGPRAWDRLNDLTSNHDSISVGGSGKVISIEQVEQS